MARWPDPRPDDVPWPRLAAVPPSTMLTGQWVELAVVDPDRDAGALFAALDHDVCWTHVAGRPASAAALAELLRQRLADGWVPWVVRCRQASGFEAGVVLGTTSFLEVSATDA